MSASGGADAGCVQTLLRRMVDSLVAGGDLRSPEWRDAFGRVPRHLFVPVIYRQLPQAGRYERIDGSRPERAEEWLRLVYSDDTHTVQINGDSQGSPDPGRAAGDIVEGTATSSSTMPSLMALMLEALDVTDDSAVLEIGTGTGYNTALLCERLGAPNVTSIDVDAALVDAARARLAALGHAPTLAVRDGEDGYPANAPYDRILATCSVTHVPRAWVTQCRPGGVIVTSLYRELGGGPLARLTVHDDGTASGRFLPTYAGFMPVRAHPAADLVDMLGAVPDDAGTSRSATINGTVLDDPDSCSSPRTSCPMPADCRPRMTPAGGPGCWPRTAPGRTKPPTTRGRPRYREAHAASGTPSKTPTCSGQRWAAHRANGSA